MSHQVRTGREDEWLSLPKRIEFDKELNLPWIFMAGVDFKGR